MKMFGTDGIRDFPYKNFLKKEALIKIGYSFSFFLKRNYKNTKNESRWTTVVNRQNGKK